jgi:hypothetical protein
MRGVIVEALGAWRYKPVCLHTHSIRRRHLSAQQYADFPAPFRSMSAGPISVPALHQKCLAFQGSPICLEYRCSLAAPRNPPGQAALAVPFLRGGPGCLGCRQCRQHPCLLAPPILRHLAFRVSHVPPIRQARPGGIDTDRQTDRHTHTRWFRHEIYFFSKKKY